MKICSEIIPSYKKNEIYWYGPNFGDMVDPYTENV